MGKRDRSIWDVLVILRVILYRSKLDDPLRFGRADDDCVVTTRTTRTTTTTNEGGTRLGYDDDDERDDDDDDDDAWGFVRTRIETPGEGGGCWAATRGCRRRRCAQQSDGDEDADDAGEDGGIDARREEWV